VGQSYSNATGSGSKNVVQRRLKVPGVRFHELGWKEPLWRIGIAWNRDSEKLTLISRLLKVVQTVVGDEEV
jgi:hypothetical protein